MRQAVRDAGVSCCVGPPTHGGCAAVCRYVLVAPDLLVTRTGVGGIDGDMLAGDSSLMTGSAMLDGDSKVLGGGGSSVLASPPPLGKQHLTRHNDSGFLSPLPPPPKGPNASTSTFSDAGKPLTAPAQPSSRRRAANRKHGKGSARSLGPKQRRPGSGSSRGSSRGSARGRQSGARGGRGGARSGARGSKRGNHRGQAAASPPPQPPSPMRHESVGDGTSSGGGGGSVGGGESSLLSMPTTVTDTLADQSSLNMRSHLSAGTVTPGVGARPSMFGGPSVAMLDSVMELRGEGSLLASGPAGDGESVWTYVTEEGSSIVSDAPVRRHAGFQPLSTCKTAPSFSITSRVKCVVAVSCGRVGVCGRVCVLSACLCVWCVCLCVYVSVSVRLRVCYVLCVGVCLCDCASPAYRAAQAATTRALGQPRPRCVPHRRTVTVSCCPWCHRHVVAGSPSEQQIQVCACGAIPRPERRRLHVLPQCRGDSVHPWSRRPPAAVHHGQASTQRL